MPRIASIKEELPIKNCPKCGKEHNKPGTFCSRSCVSASRTHSESTKQKLRELRPKKELLLKICPKCQKEHFKPGVYCSRTCANSRVHSEATKQKTSLTLKGRPRKIRISNVGTYDKEKQVQKAKETCKNRYKNVKFENLTVITKRKKVFEDQNYCCNNCGLSEWMNKPITLELEHKDGNNKNNSRENLEGLCPNCHSLTDTWRGRNNKNFNKYDIIVSDEFLLECLNKSKSIRKGLSLAGLTDKQANYARAYKALGIFQEVN